MSHDLKYMDIIIFMKEEEIMIVASPWTDLFFDEGHSTGLLKSYEDTHEE